MTNTIYAEIETLLTASPILAFDLAIESNEVAELTPEEANVILLRCILAVAGHLTDSANTALRDAPVVLGNTQEIGSLKATSACLLRWLSFPSFFRWLQNRQLGHRVAQVLDKSLGNDLYKRRNIQANSQPHEKLVALAEMTGEAVARYRESLAMLSQANSINAHQQKLLQTLNSSEGKAVVIPFLPADWSAKLKNSYKSVQDYFEARDDIHQVVHAHNDASQAIQEVQTCLEGFPTGFSRFMQEVPARLLDILDRDFSTNRAIQPASVRLALQEKRFPLHLEVADLGFILSNTGAGIAYNIEISLVDDESRVRLGSRFLTLERLEPGVSQFISVSCQMLMQCDAFSLLAECSWKNYDGDEQRWDGEVLVTAQRADIDWEQLQQKDPYSLEPILSHEDLVGRKDVMNRLISIVNAPRAKGSAMIWGQKRVGKTSIARALESRLRSEGHLVVYVEGGDYTNPDEVTTIRTLGELLCERIRDEDSRYGELEVPKFDNSLTPLIRFLDRANKLVPEQTIIVILDEFDELPSGLYRNTPIADAFFLSLRSVSARPNLGFVLVGGEKMRYVMEYQGHQLNKWVTLPVDYFSREDEWTDYVDLIKWPVRSQLEFTDGALYRIHEHTAGNPYFTNQLCKKIFELAARRRDCHITDVEVDQALNEAASEAAQSTFQHFWSDGLIDTLNREEVTIRRRKVLVAVSDSLKLTSPEPAPHARISEQALVRDFISVRNDLEEFVKRNVLLEVNGAYEFKVPFFKRWLAGHSINDIIAISAAEADAALRLRRQEEEARISPREILDLVDRWGTYKGQRLSEDRLRAWLDQFRRSEQRTMFRLLEGIRYYSDSYVKQKIAEIHATSVGKGLTRRIEPGQKKRNDILVSYLDGPAKSGAVFARHYAGVAEIYKDCVVERTKLPSAIAKARDIQAVVFVDDFVCTGSSASKGLYELAKDLDPVFGHAQGPRLFFLSIVAYSEGWRKIEEVVDDLEIPIEAYCCIDLDDKDRCFSDQSAIFLDQVEREAARGIVAEYSSRLGLRNISPLGYGDLGMAVVFESGCPNNTLPILWAEVETSNFKWTPLFKR